MTPQHRLTFRQILGNSRVETATTAWERASVASRLRHGLVSVGHHRGARRLGELKARCLERVVEILPEQVRVTIDNDYQVGLISVRWPGRGRFHLPADSLTRRPARSNIRVR
jgi:hypothetical protein